MTLSKWPDQDHLIETWINITGGTRVDVMMEDVNIKLNWTPIKRRWIVIHFLLILPLFLPNLRQALFCTNRTARPPINSVAFLRPPARPPPPSLLLDQNPKFHGNYEILCRHSPSLHHNHQLSLLFFPITGREC